MRVKTRPATKGFAPTYLRLYESGELGERVDRALLALRSCEVCPRNCRVNRLEDRFAVCKTGRHAVVASYFPHFGEEDCLRGWKGSGTIFFSGCNLRCVFCQNWDISQNAVGAECPPEKVAGLMLDLQRQGCHNINFVTPEHVVPQVLEAIALAIPRGLRLPIVYNTSAYDSVASLKLLDGIVDIYMPDFKFWERETARRLAKAKDYPDRAREAIQEMHRQVGPLKFGHDGLARRGVLVRHLVMPGRLEDTRQIVGWLAGLSKDTYLNLMDQYYPAWKAKTNPRFADINRRVTHPEMAQAAGLARAAGLWRLDERWRQVSPWAGLARAVER